MKKIYYVFWVLTLAFFISCNKKNSTPATSPQSNSSPTAINYYGVLNSYIGYSILSGSVISFAPYNDALFSSASLIEPNDGFYTNTTIEPGQVSVNGIVFTRDTFNKSISPDFKLVDSSGNSFSNIQTWNITGGAGISNFTYIDTVQFPIFTNFSSLLDTIKLSQTNTINLPGLSNCDDIYYALTSSTGHIWKNVSANTSITLSVSDLTPITGSVGSLASLLIVLYSKNYKNLGGKTIKIQKMMLMSKAVYLSP